jgi:hypothetical protein
LYFPGTFPPNATGYTSFAGDNRGFGVLGGSARLYQSITVDLNPNDPTIISTRHDTGITTGFDSRGKAYYGKAPTAGLSETATALGGVVIIDLSGVASNPLINGSPPINQHYRITLSPSGGGNIRFTIAGSTKLFPDYEIYIGCELVYSHRGGNVLELALPPLNVVSVTGLVPAMSAPDCPR